MNVGMMMGMGMMTGMPPPPGFKPPGVGGDDARDRRKKEKSKRDKSDEEVAAEADEDASAGGSDAERGSADGGGSSGSREPRRRRRRSRERQRGGGRRGMRSGRDRKERERTPERIPEVDRFIDDNNINGEAAGKIRALSPESQRRVISRPLTGDVQNPSKVMIARVRELQNQNEKAKSSSAGNASHDAFAMWGGAMLGATPEAINKYIDDNDLDDSAARQLRSLPPHNQAIAIRWDLSKCRNPSAKFMSMAAALGSTPPQMPTMPPPIPGMYGMPPPHGVAGIPNLYSMPPGFGGHPGMTPPALYGMPPPGMGPPPMMGYPPPGR